MIAYAATTDAGEVVSGTASELARLLEMIFTRIPLWIAAFIVIILAVIVAKIGRKIIEKKLAERGIEEEHQELQILGGRMTYTVILTLGITVGLKIAGIDLTTIIAAVAFGIGFALKDLIINFLAGVFILISRHFTIGDFIKIGATIGRVIEIQSRTTILQAIDGTKVIVPNADLFKKQVISFTSNPFRRIELEVGVDYRHSLENVLKVCMNAVKNTKGILIEPKPAVLVNEFGENGVGIKVKAWVDSKGGWVKVKSALAENIKKDFDEYGIKIPWPIRTIAYDKDMEVVEKKLAESEPPAQTPSATQPTTPAVQPQEAVASSDDEKPPLKPLGEQ